MKNRNEVSENLKWKTEHLFASQEEWDELYKNVESRIDFAKYEGKLGTAEGFKSCYDEMYSVIGDLEKLGIYASMRHDEDARVSEFNALMGRIDALEVKFSSAVAFVTPELTSLDEKLLLSYSENPELKDYDYEIKEFI